MIKPKKASLIKAHKIAHKASSALTAKTEKVLGDKAGHLEVLRGKAGREKKGGKEVVAAKKK